MRGLLAAAGFTQIEVSVQTGRVRFPSPRALACSYGALSGLEADAATRDAPCEDVARLLAAYCRPDGFDCPVEAVLARAS